MNKHWCDTNTGTNTREKREMLLGQALPVEWVEWLPGPGHVTWSGGHVVIGWWCPCDLGGHEKQWGTLGGPWNIAIMNTTKKFILNFN